MNRSRTCHVSHALLGLDKARELLFVPIMYLLSCVVACSLQALATHPILGKSEGIPEQLVLAKEVEVRVPVVVLFREVLGPLPLCVSALHEGCSALLSLLLYILWVYSLMSIRARTPPARPVLS